MSEVKPGQLRKWDDKHGLCMDSVFLIIRPVIPEIDDVEEFTKYSIGDDKLWEILQEGQDYWELESFILRDSVVLDGQT